MGIVGRERLRTQSPEGERTIVQHKAQVHVEPRQSALYPILPAEDDYQFPEEAQQESADTVHQEIPPEAYGQQPSINPSFQQQAYVNAGRPIQLRANKLTTRRRTKSAAATTPTKAFNDYPNTTPTATRD